jgi:hypothetical protein
MLSLGIVRDDGGLLGLAAAASAAAIVLLWAGVTRSSRPPQRDGEG